MQKSHRQWVRRFVCGGSVVAMLLTSVGCTSTDGRVEPRASVAGAYTGHRTHFAPAATRRIPVMAVQPLPPAQPKPQITPLVHPPTVINIKKLKPVEKKPKILAPLPELPKVRLLTYKVQKNDTLSHVAEAYRVGISELANQNNMNKDDVLLPGRVLTIPPGGRTPPNGVVRKKPPAVKYYTVQDGDYLGKIALKTQTTVVDLKKWNNLSSDRIRPGQKLALGPGGKFIPRQSLRPAKRPIPANGKHEVKSGQSISTIAYRYGLTIRELKAFNGLTTNHIIPGQMLKLRNKGDASEGHEVASNPPKPQPNQTALKPTTKINLKDYTLLPHFVDQSGDTIKGIAEMYGSKVAWIMDANPDIKSDSDLRKKREIRVPVEELNAGTTNP